ncbi:hypothetical protein [Prevotella sp.]|nr:hypothetical protein [Prevotella sp.]
MTNYLALIRKADFTDLFKYGKLHINNDMKTDFSCSVEKLPFHPEVFFNLTHFANSFDSAFAYLIIHYVKDSTKGLANDVYIEEVQNIYPLDFESKEAFAMSFDERIRIENPIWPDSVWNLQKQQQFNDCLKGAANLRAILGFSNSDHECKKIISDDIVREVVNELYEENRPTGDLPIWVYLLRYERHSYYPQSTLGYFMDMVNVVCNRMASREVEEDDIKITQIFVLLDSLRKHSELQYKQIYQWLVENIAAQGFFKKINEYESRVNFSKVATLFLILRNKYKEDFFYEKEFIEYCKSFGFEFELAAYLLGIVLGHEHTYDCMYDMLPLSIFKKAIKSHITNQKGWDPLIGEKTSEDKDENKTPEAIQTEQVGKDTSVILSKLEADETINVQSVDAKDAPTEETSDMKEAFLQEATIKKEDSMQEDIQGKEHTQDSLEKEADSSSDDKNLFGEDEIKYPIYMRKKPGGRPRTIKNEKEYAKKHWKNIRDGYTIESNE